MMTKKELRALPAIEPTPAVMRLAKNDARKKQNKYTKKMQYEYAYYGAAAKHGKYLVLAMWKTADLRKKKRKAAYEVYIDAQSGGYIVRDLTEKEEKWGRKKICNITGWNKTYRYQRDGKHLLHVPKTSEKLIRDTLNCKCSWKSVDEIVDDYWGNIESGKEADLLDRRIARWNTLMDKCPAEPVDFRRWLKKHIVKEFFIFYEYKRKVTEGYCTFCEDYVELTHIKPQMGHVGRCPKCGQVIVFKTIKRTPGIFLKDRPAQLIQQTKDGLWIREYHISVEHEPQITMDPHFNIHERVRLFRDNDGKVEVFRSGGYRWHNNEWTKDEKGFYSRIVGEIYHEAGETWEKALEKNSAYKIARDGRSLNFCLSSYLLHELENPALEKTAKAGMKALFFSMKNDHGRAKSLIDKKQTELAKILKIDNARMKRLKRAEWGLDHLIWLQEEKRRDTIWPDDTIGFLGEHRIEPDELDFIRDRMSVVQIANYLAKQAEISGNSSVKRLLGEWKDYLQMAEKAKMQTDREQIYKPKDISVAHKTVITILQSDDIKKQAKQMVKKWTKVDEVCGTLTKYEYTADGYAIIAPRSAEDVIREGIVLGHCVHTCDYYWDRMNRRETYILFLRRASARDTPYYTLEVEPSGNIRQKRTTGDNQNKDFEDAKDFLRKWQQVVKKRLTAEDKKLGKKSDAARKKEYAKLRVDGNKVWHGVLQGKLLADVLENDFMPVDMAGEREELPQAAG